MRMRVVLAVAATLLLVGPATSTADASVSKADPVPKPIRAAHGKPGKPVTLRHKAHKGDVVKVNVTPFPMTSCSTESSSLTLRGPGGTKIPWLTLDDTVRIRKTGTWSWTYKPCPGDKVAYSLKATPFRNRPLKINGPPVRLGVHAKYADAVTFVPPAKGRVILLGRHGGLVGPNGLRVLSHGRDIVFNDGRVVAVLSPKTLGRYTILGGNARVRFVTPTKVSATVDGPPVALKPVGSRPVGEYAVGFSVPEDTWVSTRLTDWTDGPYGETYVDVDPLDGQPDPTRTGAPWHLAPGRYVARVMPSTRRAHGSFTLTSVVPVQVTDPGDYELTAGPDLAGLALYDLGDGNHTIEVVGPAAGTPGWQLTWTKDAPPEPCVSALDCMTKMPATLPGYPRPATGQGYLGLVSTDGEAHTVTVRIGAD